MTHYEKLARETMKSRFKKTPILLVLAGMLLPSLALAQDDLNGANTAWILTSTALVLYDSARPLTVLWWPG